MPLIVVCGQPAAGKSTVAAKLKDAFAALGLAVAVVDEPSLHLIRNDSYKDSASEKDARGKLKSAVERAISKKSVVILDSLNNIKVISGTATVSTDASQEQVDRLAHQVHRRCPVASMVVASGCELHIKWVKAP